MPRRHRRSLLLTGSTPIQCGSEKTRLGILTAMRCWAAIFNEMGYDVDWRPVIPGESLATYHRVIATLNAPNKITSSHVHGALWCLSQRPDTVVAIDDWQTKELVSGIATCSRSKDRLFRLRGGDLDEQTKDVVFSQLQSLDSPWNFTTLTPVLGSGDLSLLKLPGRIAGVDPTIFSPRSMTESRQKSKRWVMASLIRKDLPDTGWPVSCYGNSDRGLHGVGPAGSKAQPRVRESELAEIYAENWGVLSPAHPHAGSGWWRVRYLMAADAGCVLSADPREAACLGRSYEVASDTDYVEGLSEAGLRKLARGQQQTLKKITWSKERVMDTLSSLLKSYPGGGRGQAGTE